MNKLLIALIFISLAFKTNIVNAHPHVFIISKFSLSYNNEGVKGINVNWTFDQMFTEIMLEEFDSNSDGNFNSDEVKVLYNKAFINLKKSSYFTHIFIENKEIEINSTQNFNALIKDGQLQYSFFIPMEIALSNQKKSISIYSYDDSYYMDIMIDEENPLEYDNSLGFKSDYSIIEDENKAYYFEQIFPQALIINLRKQ